MDAAQVIADGLCARRQFLGIAYYPSHIMTAGLKFLENAAAGASGRAIEYDLHRNLSRVEVVLHFVG
jgi:hypothetical protein